ncbi:hypothetical protein Cni_G18573 [Canna indica]|uniref:RING-type E3 ubiquitin transferase n=1 Tax=Canna indica TaxID=4628 RepID=A0AAQ3KJU2_9LILI|nr:hypothetical protein Cni_G18573 [Canna indica]
MSSAGADEKRYFCHQCNRTFTAAAGTGLACAHCHGDFVEEFDLSHADPNPNPIPSPDLDREFHFSFDDSDAFSAIPSLLSALIDLASSGADPAIESPPPDAGPDPTSPVSALRDLIQTLSLGAPPGAGGGGRHFVGNVGDYFVGPGLEQLIQQLAENDPNRYGTPPASKSAVESLPDVEITDGLLATDEAHCSVCMDMFETGVVAKRMPCNHIYHEECILPWLELHNSCPVCRYELPTDDPDYERHKLPLYNAVNSGGSSNATTGGLEGNSSVQTTDRNSGNNGDPARDTY